LELFNLLDQNENKHLKLLPKLMKVLFSVANIDGIYVVGGAVRDLMLGRNISDIDLVSRDIDKIVSLIDKKMSGKKVILGEKKGQHCIRYIISEKNEGCASQNIYAEKALFYIDLVKLNSGLLAQDLNDRDFSINAMALPLKSFVSYLRGECSKDVLKIDIIDPHNGQKDIKKKILREVTSNIFRNDPSRLWRLWRFSAELGFNISGSLNKLAMNDSHLCRYIPGERIRQELIPLLNCPTSADYLIKASHTGMLEQQFPEIKALKGCFQNSKYHHQDVWEHSFQVLFELEKLIYNIERYFTNYDQKLALNKWLAEYSNLAILKLSALFHDIGKPLVRDIQDDGKVCFYNHEKAGLPAVKAIANRLRLSDTEKKLLLFLVERHLQIYDLIEGAALRTKGRFLSSHREDALGLILLGAADLLAKKKTVAIKTKIKTFFSSDAPDFIDIWINKKFDCIHREPVLNGRDIINLFNIKPGPQVGLLKRALWDAQFEGIVTNKEEAIAFIQVLLDELLKNGLNK
jgi:poly(A) polymerase